MSSIIPRVAARNLYQLPISIFGNTTSAELAGIITDETGTDKLVFNTSPTFATSVTGSASMDVFDTVSTTVNAFGAATTLNIGAATGTLTLNNAAVKFSAGSVSAPSIYFDADTTSGLYRIAANDIGFAISGTKVIDISGTQFNFYGGLIQSNVPVGAGNGITIRQTAENSNTALSYSAINFNVPTSGLIGQFLSTANNYSYAAINLPANSIAIIAEATSGILWLAAAGSSGDIRFNVGGYGTANEWLRITAAGIITVKNAGVIALAAGSVSAPSLYLSTNAGSGLYQIAANNLGIAISGSKVLDIASAGLGVTGTIDATGQITVGASANFSLTANGTVSRYIGLIAETGTYAGSLQIQAGGGSVGYGGSISLYGHSHATKPGWVIAGISSGSGGKFAITNAALGDGTLVFDVDTNGAVNCGSVTTAAGLYVGTTISAHGYTVGTLPAGAAGDCAYVTDALAPAFGAVVAAGGAVVVPVFFNGANWIVG